MKRALSRKCHGFTGDQARRTASSGRAGVRRTGKPQVPSRIRWLPPCQAVFPLRGRRGVRAWQTDRGGTTADSVRNDRLAHARLTIYAQHGVPDVAGPARRRLAGGTTAQAGDEHHSLVGSTPRLPGLTAGAT
jgi:hypothetical protein